MTIFALPAVITELVMARDRVRDHYNVPGLAFTLDGKLVGDIGEAVAAEMFGLTLTPGGGTGIDGHTANRRSVQVKATGTNRGAVFRCVETRADHLIFLEFNFAELKGEVVFNGPEHIVLHYFPATWLGQRSISNSKLRSLNKIVSTADRLPVIDPRPGGDKIESENSAGVVRPRF